MDRLHHQSNVFILFPISSEKQYLAFPSPDSRSGINKKNWALTEYSERLELYSILRRLFCTTLATKQHFFFEPSRLFLGPALGAGPKFILGYHGGG